MIRLPILPGARSIVAGDGYREAWLASNQPVTHFPLHFRPSLHSLDSWASTRSMLRAGSMPCCLARMRPARHPCLAHDPSLTAGLVLAGLFVLCAEMLQVHAMAMSEPLFIFLSLLSLWMFDLYFERDHHWCGWWPAGCSWAWRISRAMQVLR
jgi:hypothetical protein